jgi:hypothetical protein
MNVGLVTVYLGMLLRLSPVPPCRFYSSTTEHRDQAVNTSASYSGGSRV